jgi:DNA-binding SARP family transcriptional activator
LSVYDLPGPGIALTGDGAIPAARGVLASALATGVTETTDRQPVVVTTATLLERLLPGGEFADGLNPGGWAFDGERLIVLADTAAALTHAEEETVARVRVLEQMGAGSVTELNTRLDHAELHPAYLLLTDTAATDSQTARLAALGRRRAALHLLPITLGPQDGWTALDIAADGTTTLPTEPGPARVTVLAEGDLADLLRMVAASLPRAEPGHEPDDPQPEPHPPAAPTAPTVDDLDVDRPQMAGQDEVPPAGATATIAQLHVLGPVTVHTASGKVGTGMRSGSYATLALLAANPAGRTLDQIATDLYPDTDPKAAIKRVRTDITTTRRVLRAAAGNDEARFVVYDNATSRYHLQPAEVSVDLWQMLTALHHANQTNDDLTALTHLREAVELYGGDFAEGHDRAWVTDYATTYRHQYLAAQARIAELVETDQPELAVAALEAALRYDPVNEELYQRLMIIHGRQHRPDAVRRTLRLLEHRLMDLGGAEPSEATLRVAHRQLHPDNAGTRT